MLAGTTEQQLTVALLLFEPLMTDVRLSCPPQPSTVAAGRRLGAVLSTLAAHAAQSRQRCAAAEALAARRKGGLLRSAVSLWSGWAASRRRLRAASDLVRL